MGTYSGYYASETEIVTKVQNLSRPHYQDANENQGSYTNAKDSHFYFKDSEEYKPEGRQP